MNMQVLEAALKVAISNAIRKVGMDTFKRTSLFGSNESQAELKKAA